MMLYDFSSYICTDPDSLQFCKKEGQRVWWYFQIVDKYILDKYEGKEQLFISAYNNDEYIDGRNIRKAVDEMSHVSATIDLDEYDVEDIEQCLHRFGFSMKGDRDFVDITEECGDALEQLCCEFLFEEMIPELLVNEQIELLRL